MRRHVCHLNRVDKMCLIIFRIAFLSIKFTIVVVQYILTSLHTEKYQFSVMSVLYYNYYIKTDHSILYIDLINTYQRFIENRTLSILNHHKNSGVGKSWNFDNICKIIKNSSYDKKCRKLLLSFPKNHTCVFCCIVYHILFIQIMFCRRLSFVLSVMYMILYSSPNLPLNKSFIRRIPNIFEKK